MAAMQLIKLSYLPQYFTWRLDFVTESYVFGIKEYNKTHGHFIPHHYHARLKMAALKSQILS